MNFLLAEQQYPTVKTLLTQLKGTKYADFAKSIETVFAQFASLQDVPAYYQDALIAHQLMQEGSLALAKKIAIPLANQYENYILPYQILANVDFLMHKRESSATYYQKLLKIDPSQRNTYLYYLGIINYQIKNYSESVLYFAQLTENKFILDGDRYLVLAYLALGEEDKALTSWQRLAGHNQLKKSDFYTFFEEALRKPYREGRSATYLTKNPAVVKSYLLLCEKKLEKADQILCQYGKLGYQIHTAASKSELATQIKPIGLAYPQSGIYMLLGDIAEEEGDDEQAIKEYTKAFKLATSTAEKKRLRQLLAQIQE